MSQLKSFQQHNLQFIFIIKSLKDTTGQMNLKTNLQQFKNDIKQILCNKKQPSNFQQIKPKCTSTIKVLSLLWTRQCEFILAHRIRRGHQMFTLYSKLWTECAIKAMLKRIRQQFMRHSRSLVLSTTAGISLFNWDENKINDEKVLEHVNELDKVRVLCKNQITCPECQNRILIDCKITNIVYCECEGLPHSVKEKFYKNPIPKSEWEPFIERKDMIVWRKECEAGKYCYKMYGSYANITADDYLDVQVNVAYRKKWDESVVDLKIIENDPESHSQIVYWEMKWPVS